MRAIRSCMAQTSKKPVVGELNNDVARRIKKYALCSTSVSSDESAQVFSLVEAAKLLLQERGGHFALRIE